MAMTTMVSSWVDMLGGVVSESKRIVAAHSRHFLALSVLFLLPLSLLLVAAPTFRSSLLHPDRSGRHPLLPPPKTLLRSTHHHDCGDDHPPTISREALVFSLLYASAAVLLSLCAAASVTHSVRHSFFGRPVRLLPALRSLPSSLWRLLLTLISAALLLSAYLAILASLLLLCLRVLPLLGLDRHHLVSPICFTAVALGLALGAVYLQVNWALAGVVTVVESSWGFEPLRRSAHLVRGMRWAALCLALFFSAGIGLMLWGTNLGGAVEMKDWSGVPPVVARVVCASAVTMLLLLESLVTNAVLYMYCKALQGELAGEVAEEFAREYVCLPFDDQKVPHVLSVVWQ